MTLFDINNIAFELIEYKISFAELIGTIFGLISVYFASKTNILTWSTGIINELFLFIVFFQVQLYADMFLQVYFFIVTLYGWYNWKQKVNLNSITSTNSKTKLWLTFTILLGTLIAGNLLKNIHSILPQFFKVKAAFPFIDSFVMMVSIIATILLAKKKIETWYLWIIVNIVCVFLFYHKGILFLATEYLFFLGLATFGLLNWKKQMNNG